MPNAITYRRPAPGRRRRRGGRVGLQVPRNGAELVGIAGRLLDEGFRRLLHEAFSFKRGSRGKVRPGMAGLAPEIRSAMGDFFTWYQELRTVSGFSLVELAVANKQINVYRKRYEGLREAVIAVKGSTNARDAAAIFKRGGASLPWKWNPDWFEDMKKDLTPGYGIGLALAAGLAIYLWTKRDRTVYVQKVET